MERSLATLAIAVGLALALAGGILLTSGHGLAATCCISATIALGLRAYREPV
jgi:hypothetical protein